MWKSIYGVMMLGVVGLLVACGSPLPPPVSNNANHGEKQASNQNNNKTSSTRPDTGTKEPTQPAEDPSPACRPTGNCGPGKSCIDERCRPTPAPKPAPTPECQSDRDCQANQQCSEGKCIQQAQPVPCRSSSDCQRGWVCDGLVCRSMCSQDSDCKSDEQCVRAFCAPKPRTFRRCSSDAECEKDESCQRGSCQMKPSQACRASSECGQDEVCHNYACKPKSTPIYCRATEGCPHGWVCDVGQGLCQERCTTAGCPRGQVCNVREGLCYDPPKEICNGVDDNNDGQIDENACTGSCKFPLELSFTGHNYTVYLKLDPNTGACDPNTNTSALLFSSSHAGSYVGTSGNWRILSSDSGKIYGGTTLMNFARGKRVTLRILSPNRKTFTVVFQWSGAVTVYSVR